MKAPVVVNARRLVRLEREAVARWNEEYRVGQAVEFWTFTRDADGTGRRSTTRSAAQLIGGHTAVVWVEGEPSCIALSHVRPLDGEAVR